MQQARPRAVGEKAVRARPQQKQLLERVERPRDRPRRDEGAIILALGAARPAMLLDAWEGMILAQQDERKALIVAQQHIVGRPETLDQLRLEQQRLGLGIGRDDRHRSRLRDHALQPSRQPRHLRVVGDTVAQRARLADVQHFSARILHPVDAGTHRQRGEHVADRGHAGFEIGLLRSATDGVRGFLFVKAILAVRVVGHGGDVGFCNARGKIARSPFVPRRCQGPSSQPGGRAYRSDS